LIGLKQRGLTGVYLTVTDQHEGLKQAIAEVLPISLWQRCYVHFLRNALAHVPGWADPACLQELRWLYDRRDVNEARHDLSQWLVRWQVKYPKLCLWEESAIEGNLRLLPSAPRTPQAAQVHQPALTAQPRF
jgi:putative transposase